MTLIEMTVVIVVLLSLVTLLMVGARGWKRGSDRSGCIMQIRQVQNAVRSYANMNNHYPGTDISPINLEAELIGADLFLESTPTCPGQGLYKFGGNLIPEVGDLYMTCSLSDTEEHVPDEYGDW